MEKEKVSAIIPVYNCEKYVREAVESALAQTCPPHEIIVVDDGSTDGTREALDRYRNSIIYVCQKNAGEPAARNTGIQHASGEYIAFLDADDLWLPPKLQLQMDYFKAHPECALVYTDMMIFDDDGILDRSFRASHERVYRSGRIFQQIFFESLFNPSCVVFRKACIEKVGWFDESFLVGSDYDMWLRMARHFEFGYVDSPLLMYRQHPQMSTRGLGIALKDGMPWLARVLKTTLDRYPEALEELGEPAVNRRLALPYFWLGQAWMEQGRHVEARGLFSAALRYHRWSMLYHLAYLATFLTPSQISRVRSAYRKVRRIKSSAKIADRYLDCQRARN